MPWAAGTYTKGNNATGGWAGDAAVNIGIEAGRHDTQDNDFATGISQCLNKDGSNAATGNLNLGTNKITNLGAPTSANDAATKTYIDTLVGPVTAAGRALIDDADAAAQRTTLGLGTLATQSGTFSGTSSGTNTGDQTITLTGNVTGSGTGSFAATIANDAVTYAKMQNVSATDRILGRQSAGSGDVEEITCTSAGRALIDDVDAAAQRTTLGLGTVATQAGTAVTSLNGITGQATQTFATGTTGTDFAISSAGSTHTFNIPNASTTARGLITSGNQTLGGRKTFSETWLVQTLDGNACEYTNFINSGSNPAIISLNKSKSGVIGNQALLSNGDQIGQVNFASSNGTALVSTARVMALANGTQTASSLPTRLAFSTCPDGSTTLTEQMTLLNNGRLGLGTATPTRDFTIDKTVNTDVVFHPYNRSNGTSATAGILFGNDEAEGIAKISMNSTTHSAGNSALQYINSGTGGSHTFVAGGANRLIIAAAGTVQMNAYGAGTATFAANGVISSTSDERLKIKDGSIEDAKSKLEALEPGYWYWKPEVAANIGDQRELGFFAQNVNAAIGEEAAPTPEDGKAFGYYDRSVLAVTVQAFKDLMIEFAELQARVEALEA
jgi:hypothetical protein